MSWCPRRGLCVQTEEAGPLPLSHFPRSPKRQMAKPAEVGLNRRSLVTFIWAPFRRCLTRARNGEAHDPRIAREDAPPNEGRMFDNLNREKSG